MSELSNQDGAQAAGAVPAIPIEIQKRMDEWHHIFNNREIWNNFIGISSMVASSLAATRILPPQGTTILAVLATILTSILTFLGLGKKASAYKAAWRVADRAAFNYWKNPTKDKHDALYEAKDEGERIIAQADI